jgi:hypothetical protein
VEANGGYPKQYVIDPILPEVMHALQDTYKCRSFQYIPDLQAAAFHQVNPANDQNLLIKTCQFLIFNDT